MKDLDILYWGAIGLLLEREAQHKSFFTNDEFERNKGVIWKLTSAYSRLKQQLVDAAE